jgi:DEAD/DEAH box helicase domain-containing protein
MHYRVFDLEILRTIEEVGGWDASSKMGVSCCVVYDSKTRSFRVFGDSNVKHATDYILDCDLVVGFNHVNFDWRVLLGVDRNVDIKATIPMISKPQYDVFLEVRKAAGVTTYEKGHKLEQIAMVNLGRGKRMSGDLAPIAWRAGKYCEVIDYCIDDVALTRDLFEMILGREPFIDPRTGRCIQMPDPEVFMDSWRASMLGQKAI